METYDELVGRVRVMERVQRYDRTGDASVVLGPGVDHEMDLLAKATLPNGDRPVPAVAAPGTLRLFRALDGAGYRHVVATLWNVHDAPAARLARAVYGRLITGGSIAPAGAADALHHAVRALRAEQPYRPGVWAPFLHMGP
ncbi:CHAT domain-containing protein [Streptomyces roseoverticillatus]|uniref:CHAT domain-containing protein n=1 Tax=Streptomyces roseoverticillatus TaxID=66429 RepID=UPI001F219BE9|nr:CHAT domain-containing protein [Streptomyces roseoverticillatus]MCF3106403.1 CHAT domain-containing protein [Streptomyces roseoverticillatus]